MVLHGHVAVHGRKVTVPSYQVKPGDVITPTVRGKDHPRVKELAATGVRNLPSWLQFTPDPLEGGFGVTLGNALRRTLLSAIPGAAVTSVKIENVLHEFSTIPGVVEDVTQVILNLKELTLRLHTDKPKLLRLEAKGKKTVTAAAVIEDAEVDVLNPDLQIATIDKKDAKLAMELVVERGKGYVPAEKHRKSEHVIGVIPVDS